jgi:quinoprotein glucose dehydrogenase
VDGRFRGEIKRPLEPVQKNSLATLNQMLGHKDVSIREHAAKAFGKLKIDAAAASLMAQLKKDPSPQVQVAALRSLAELKGNHMDEAIKFAITNKEKSVRVAGLDLLSKSQLDQELMVSLLDDVIRNRTPEEKQAAITTLGTLPVSHTEKVFVTLLDQMQAGKLANEVRFELADAIDSTHSQALKDRYIKLSRNASPDSLKAAYAGALQGGNPEKGAYIFWANSSAQCIRCHAINDYGGNVGPRLNGVAKRLKQEQLLEALIEPSARIAPGFGIVTLETKNKQNLNGILQQEKPEGYVMKIGDRPDTLVKKSDVANRINSASSMPPMHLLLNKKEIRDVVAFLSTLKN